MFEKELNEIRVASKAAECESWTSRDYQDDIIRFLIENRSEGSGVIEVGTYKGGLTAQLALICKQFGWPLYSLDICGPFQDQAANLVSSLGLSEVVTFHLGPLSSFSAKAQLKHRPVLAILDGDHHYDAVIDDINAVHRLNRQPFAVAFHDYCLRHPTSEERVDDAVRDAILGAVASPIGVRMTGDDRFPTQEKPSSDGHWWKVPGSEGAIVKLRPRSLIESIKLPLRRAIKLSLS